MAQDPSIEAARARIQKLVEEIAALSRQEIRSEDYFQQFLERVVQATDARGGAVWLVAPRPSEGKNDFQLVAQVELESSGFRAGEEQHAFLSQQLSEVVQTKKARVAAPPPPAPDPGSLEAQLAQMQGAAPAAAPGGNRMPYPFFHVPLMLREQLVGVLQVWLQPYVQTANYGEFVTFLTSLATHVEHHLHSRRLGTLVLENQRLQQVLRFSSDLAGSLDALEVARLAANYGRDLIGCERCSVLSLRGDRWAVQAISGQEVVEKKSGMVKAMVAFIGAHAEPEAFKLTAGDPVPGTARHELLVLSKEALLARAAEPREGELVAPEPAPGEEPKALVKPVRRTDEVDRLYFEHSHVASAAIAPMFNAEGELTGAYFAESTTEGYFEAPGGREASSSQRMTEWLAQHTGKVLQAAQDYQGLPLLAVSRRLRNTHLAMTGRSRQRFWWRTALLGGLLLLLALYPKMDQVDGNCSVIPRSRGVVVPEVSGRVEKVLVREGTKVKKGEPLAELDKARLEIELESTRQEQFRARAEADRLRGLGDEAQSQVAALQAGIAQKAEEKTLRDLAAATLRSPVDGVILTKDLQLHVGEFIQAGTPFAEVASLDDWEVQVEVNEKSIGRIGAELARRSPLAVNYILYSQSAFKLQGDLHDARQISAQAYPREKENVFIVTLYGIAAPPELQADLRPGLTGRAKIALHREPLIWWAGKATANWLRAKLLH